MHQALRGDAHLAGRQVVDKVPATLLSSRMIEVYSTITEPVAVQVQQLAKAALLRT